MKHKYSLPFPGFILLFLIYGGILKAQIANPFSHSARARRATQSQKMTKLMKGAVEVPSKRTLFSATYKTDAGKIICRYSSNLMNYPDVNGNLQPIKIELHSDPKGWVADQQPYPCYFRLDRSTSISLGKEEELGFNIQSSINGSIYDEFIASLSKDFVSLALTPQIHKKITFSPNSIETDYIIDSSIGPEITISEELKFPANYKIISDNKRGRESKYGWCGDYILVSGRGNFEAARFHAPLCYDSKGKWCIGSYKSIVKDGKTILITSVPSDWISKAVYPIIIDPLVTGRTAKWKGGSIPSCVFPNFSKDSIRVTIPGKITITDFIVNYAYQTNPSVPVYFPDGKFYFSTSCGGNISDTMSCDNLPSEATQTGACYLDTTGNDFRQLLTCCYPPSCDSQTFYISQHLARMQGGSGCDTNWVWYTKYISSSQWYYQFMATIVGNTVQPDSVNPLVVTPQTQCAGICTLKMTVNVNYGVPPYKVSHTWDTTKYTMGSYSNLPSCNSTGTKVLTLTIPGCPKWCGVNDTITVPPPLVIDFCGDTAKGWPTKRIVLKPAPKITSLPDTLSVCNGAPLQLTLTSCMAGTAITWKGSNGSSGKGSINFDTSVTKPDTIVYKIVGSVGGCSSDTLIAKGIVNTYPIVKITGIDTINLGSSDKLSASGGSKYLWQPSTGLSCDTCHNPIVTPTVTTVYTVTVTNKGGCETTDSIRIVVLDEQIIIPNVITPNGDGTNDYFEIKDLQNYPNSSLVIFDRWGKQVYSSTNYANNWDGGGQSDGVYYYLLSLTNGTKYKGFVQIIK